MGKKLLLGTVAAVGLTMGITSASQPSLSQAGAGLRWQLAEWITLDVGYRFRIIEGPEFNANTDHVPGAVTDFDVDWIGSHNVIGGISFGF